MFSAHSLAWRTAQTAENSTNPSLTENAGAYHPLQQGGKTGTPTRRAALSTLKAGQGNVSVLQRLKNFVAPPARGSAMKVLAFLHTPQPLKTQEMLVKTAQMPATKGILRDAEVPRSVSGVFGRVCFCVVTPLSRSTSQVANAA